MKLHRRDFLAAGAGVVALVSTWKLAPRVYNARRMRALAGRHIYDEDADTDAIVRAGLARASREHKRVLVILGGNWCEWCLALDDLMTNDVEIRRLLAERFVVVHLDSTAAARLDEAWGNPTRMGVPVLVFLDADGSVLHLQSSVPLEELGGRLLAHDRGRVLGVIRAWL